MPRFLGLIVAVLASQLLSAQTKQCETLRETKIPHADILTAEPIENGHFLPPAAKDKGFTDLPPFCRVVAAIHPSSDSDIRVEVWMPLKDWGGRALGTGNGGFAGSIAYGSLASGLRSGYAVANTDMGMAVPPGGSASAFIGRPERWRDWGYRATHEMAIAHAALVRAFYGHAAAHTYFSGCSTGGEQALMEAQRFPQDYEGIVAGAPANNRTNVHLSVLWNYTATQRTPAAAIPKEKLELLHAKVLAACDAQDGVRDGLLADPFACSFDPATLLCKAGESNKCLSAEQVETVRRIYAGPKDPKTGKIVYPGVPRGSELEWGPLEPAPPSSPPYGAIFQWVFGPSWDWRTFDWSSGPPQIENKLAKDLNANDGNLTAFRKRGGKLIYYHGLADWLVTPGETLRYNEAVQKAMKGKTEDFYRLYLIPGMGHCGGGTGPNTLPALPALAEWVEKGTAPGQLTATRTPVPASGPVQRPICVYPQLAKYRGSGDPNQPDSFTCGAATR